MTRIKGNYLIVIVLLVTLNSATLLSVSKQSEEKNKREKNKIYYFKIERMEKIVSKIPCINWKFKIKGSAKIEIFFKSRDRFKKIFEYENSKGIFEYNHFDRSDKCYKFSKNFLKNKEIKIFFYKITWNNNKTITRTIVVK